MRKVNKDSDVLLRAQIVLRELYDEINSEEWVCDEKLYDEKMSDFFIISNALNELIQYRYVKGSMTKEEYKDSVNRLINKNLK